MKGKTSESIIAEDIMKGFKISDFIRNHRSINEAGPELVSKEIADEIERRLKTETGKAKDQVLALLYPTLSQPFDPQSECDYLELCVLPNIYMSEYYVSISGSQLYRKLISLLEAIEKEWNRSPVRPFRIHFYPLTRDEKSTIRVKRERCIMPDTGDEAEY